MPMSIRSRTRTSSFTCPRIERVSLSVGAHIRRVNPRDSRVNDTPTNRCGRRRATGDPARHQLRAAPLRSGRARRRKSRTTWKTTAAVRGLHFLGVNADIARQFEFLRRAWCNNPTFNAEFETSDPIVRCNRRRRRHDPTARRCANGFCGAAIRSRRGRVVCSCPACRLHFLARAA